MLSQKMSVFERRSVFSLSMIMSLRMLGLFMVLPLFTLYALQLSKATPTLVGISLGIYGLTQALLQIPFGALSDSWGRKKIIAFGFSIFTIGSIVSALAGSIWVLMLGRAIQGAGAVGSVIIAFIADLTHVDQRSKALAISGMTIGASFILAMILGPLFARFMHVNGIFWLTAFLGLLAIFLLYTVVPAERARLPLIKEQRLSLWQLLIAHPELLRLDIGIFLLHTLFTATFVVVPILLQTHAHLAYQEQWLLYLPILIMAFLLSLPCIMVAEKKKQVKSFLLAAICILGLAEILLWVFADHLLLFALSLLLFFSAFSLLEAFLPSLVSKMAPPARKGTALGIYSFSQFFGIFIGGAFGGWSYGHFGLANVNLFCAALAIIWLGIAFTMKNPHYSTTHST